MSKIHYINIYFMFRTVMVLPGVQGDGGLCGSTVLSFQCPPKINKLSSVEQVCFPVCVIFSISFYCSCFRDALCLSSFMVVFIIVMMNPQVRWEMFGVDNVFFHADRCKNVLNAGIRQVEKIIFFSSKKCQMFFSKEQPIH